MSQGDTPESSSGADFDRVLDAIMLCGLLMERHPALPSVEGLVREPVTPAEIINGLLEHPDVVRVRLVSGAWTYVHRQLWPALVAVAQSREPWQIETLDEDARRLLEAAEEGDVVIDAGNESAARVLETRLLVHRRRLDDPDADAHADAEAVETWERWCRRAGFDPAETPIEVPDGKASLDEAVATLNTGYTADGRLPWEA